MRLCIDYLRSARVRREQYVGLWIPELLLTQQAIDRYDKHLLCFIIKRVNKAVVTKR